LIEPRPDVDAALEGWCRGCPLTHLEQARHLRRVKVTMQRDAPVNMRRGAFAKELRFNLHHGHVPTFLYAYIRNVMAVQAARPYSSSENGAGAALLPP